VSYRNKDSSNYYTNTPHLITLTVSNGTMNGESKLKFVKGCFYDLIEVET